MGFLDFLDPISSVVNTVGNWFSSKQQNDANMAMMRENNDFQRQERIHSQNWSSLQRELSQKYQTSEREAQNQYSEDMYNKYSSPQAKAAAFSAAGLNPRLAAEGTNVGSISASSGSAGGAPSGGAVHGNAGSSPPYQSITSFSAGFQNMANAMKALAEAKKAGVDTRHAETLIKSVELQNAYQEAFNNVNIDELPKRSKLLTKQLEQTLANDKATYGQIKELTGKLAAEGVISWFNANHILETWQAQQDNINADTENKQSSTVLNLSKVDVNDAQIEFVNAQKVLTELQQSTEKTKPELNRSITSYNNSLERLNSIEEKINNATSEDKIDMLIQQYNKEAADAFKELDYIQGEINEQTNSKARGQYGAKLVNIARRARRFMSNK